MTSNFNIPRKDRIITLRTDQTVGCLLTSPDKLLIATNKGQIRRLTPTEYDNLMSWEKDWTKYGFLNGKVIEVPKSMRYKCGGNGVVSKVVKKIISVMFPT